MKKVLSNKFSFFMFTMLLAVLIPISVSASEEPPTTEFEDNGGTSWTSLDGEEEFLFKLDEMSDRIRVTQEGTSVLGKPIYLVRVGYPAAPSDEEIANGRNIFIMGTPHGNEPAGREGSLTMIRDLAFTEDPEMLELLSKSTFLFTPTSNPDGRAANTRGNSTGLDNNRDNLNLTQPENHFMANVLTYFQPDITLDLHERSARGADVQVLWPRNLNVDNELREYNKSMVEDFIMPTLAEKGVTSELYGSPGGAGGEDERILRNTGGLRGGLTILTESYSRHPMQQRYEVQIATVSTIIEFYGEKFDEIPGILAGAKERRAADGIDPSVPFYIDGADNWPSTTVLENKPMGYVLTQEQAENVERFFRLFPLNKEDIDNGAFVTMNQPLMTIVPLLFDERAKYNEISALPVYSLDNPGTAANMKAQVDHYTNTGGILNATTARMLSNQLTGISIFEQSGQEDKVARNLQTLKSALDQYKTTNMINDEVYNNLNSYADFIIAKAQQPQQVQ